jgi:competence protein ComGC
MDQEQRGKNVRGKTMHMRNNQMHRQRGITFIGVLIIAAIVSFVLITSAKIVPSLLEYQAIVKAVEKAKDQQTVADIERSFAAATAIDDITSINAKDLLITKENDQVKIAFAYDKEITLLGPVSLLIHYSGNTKGG